LELVIDAASSTFNEDPPVIAAIEQAAFVSSTEIDLVDERIW